MGMEDEITAGIACALWRFSATSAAPDPSVMTEELPDDDGSEGMLNPLGSAITQGNQYG